MTKLSIIILSYNTKELTKACIQSILRVYKKELESQLFEIFLVDNASSDNTVATINHQQPARPAGRSTINIKYLKVIQNKKNYGFSMGNNIAAKHAKGEYLLFLNSDAAILDHGLVGMVAFLDMHKDAGILGGRLTNVDGTNQASTGSFYTLPNVFLMLFGGGRFGLLRFSPKAKTRVDWVSGGSMMVRRDVFEKLEGFDEHFFMYVEDMEFCYRAKKEGFATYFYPDISIIHKELGSSNRTFAILNIYKGLLYFYKKHTNYIQYSLVKLLLVVKACVVIVIGVFTSNNYLTSTYRKALSLSL